MSDKPNVSKLLSRVGSSVMLLLTVALVARIIYELLLPVLPVLGTVVMLLIVYSVLFDRHRHL